MRVVLLSIALLLAITAATLAQQKPPKSASTVPASKPTSKPSSPPQDDDFTPATAEPERNAKGERIWHLTRFLQGTTEEVRNTLNHDVEMFTAKKKLLTREIDERTQAQKDDEAKIVDTIRKSPEYVARKADADKAEADMQVAQRSGSTQDKMDASSRYNRARLELQQMETSALRTSATIQHDKDEIKHRRDELAKIGPALTKAQAWRNELIEAMRFSFQMPGPVRVGAIGLIGKVTPLKIYDRQSACVRFDAQQIEGKAEGQRDADGIKSVVTRVMTANIILSGIDTSAMRENQEIALDRVFEITDLRESNEFGEVFYAEKTRPHDLDQLFNACNTIRDVDPDGK